MGRSSSASGGPENIVPPAPGSRRSQRRAAGEEPIDKAADRATDDGDRQQKRHGDGQRAKIRARTILEIQESASPSDDGERQNGRGNTAGDGMPSAPDGTSL